MGVAQRDTFRRTIKGLVRKLRSRLPKSREVWLVSLGWHISAVFLFLTLWLFQDFPELSFLALFVSIYVHVVVNHRLAERKLKAHDKSEIIRRRRELEAVRQDLTTHLDTTTQAVRQDLTTHAPQRLGAELQTSASGISYLYEKIQPKIPIWFTRGWSASPELLASLWDLILEKKPKFVLDLGSGLTTLIGGYAVMRNGTGRIEAWEHLAEFAESTTDLIAQHQLNAWAKVVHAPLVSTEIGADTYRWFDVRPRPNEPIDLLVVDSPPGSTGTQSRFPALPILLDYLSDDAVIILDDVNRGDETRVLARWAELLPGAVTKRSTQFSKSEFVTLHRNPRMSPAPKPGEVSQ